MRQVSWKVALSGQSLRRSLHAFPQSVELSDAKQLTARQLMGIVGGWGSLAQEGQRKWIYTESSS